MQAARPLAQANIAIPLLLGTALAVDATGSFDPWMLAAALVFGVLDQLFIVFANDVADEAGDRANATYNAMSGGSRVLPEGKLSRAALARAAQLMAVAMLLHGVGLAVLADRLAVPAAAALAIALLWAYSYPPLRLSYRGLGEVLQGVGVGVALPVLAWYLQVGDLAGLPWFALAPGFVLATASNVTTSLPDEPADRAAGKATWTVRLGGLRARKLSLQMIAIGVLMAPWVVPELSRTDLLMLEAGPLLALALNLALVRRADADDRRACFRFALTNGVAINLALVGWTVALWR